jgi:EAL and modified HD-GYP domain-containing signal transduction protein
MHRIVARQPILDRYERVYGYELLSRPGVEEIWPAMTSSPPVEGVFTGPPALYGMEEITEGTRAFIKCPRQALIDGCVAGLPRDHVVLEVPASSEPDAEVVAACRRWKAAGFLIALENFQGAGEEPLADVADIFKLDLTTSTDRAQWHLLRKYRPRGAKFVAEKVEKRAQFRAAVQQGFSYFQGPFFCRLEACSTSGVAPTKTGYLLVLRAVTRPEINVQEVADTIKHDLALSYKLLRFLNSPRFAFSSQIKSIRHALLLLGQDEVRKWVGLISVAAMGDGAPPILVSTALIRAALCESLAPLVGAPKRPSDYFLLGLLSCIDVLTGRPMPVVLAELPIAPDVSAALLGEGNPLRDLLQAVISYEQGDWEQCSQRARKLGLKDEKLETLYLQALRWSRALTQAEKDEPVEAKRT